MTLKSFVVEYTYDPWGKCTIVSDTSNCNLGTLNPFRYRGYYYDEDTGLYYLQSRYYDPVTCKFINADDPSILLADSYNVQCVHIYDYCGFNPVMFVDKNGHYYVKYALNYEQKWWNGRNNGYYNYGNTDCANFVSQCLFAGGFKMTGGSAPWYCNKGVFGNWAFSENWAKANSLYRYMKSYYKKKEYKVTSHKKIPKIVSNVKIGDLVFFDWDSDGRINHATIVSAISPKADIYFAAHTNSRQYYSVIRTMNLKVYKGKVTVHILTLKDKY